MNQFEVQRRWCIDTLAEASTRFHTGMRAAGLEVKLGDPRLQSQASQLNVQVEVGNDQALGAVDELVATCVQRRWERFYPLPVAAPDGHDVGYCSAIGPLRLMVTYDVGAGPVAAFDVLGREA